MPLITIVGLGPGDASLLTVEARDVLASASEVWLRTSRHPTVGGLPTGPAYGSFDEIYEREPTFDAVYAAIVERVLELGARPEGVVYAVPGHPMFGEATVRALMLRAPERGTAIHIVAGVSFLETIASALGVDPLTDGLVVLDALALSDRSRMLVPQRPTIIAQVYDQNAASQAKLALLEAYPPEHPVRVVTATGTRDQRIVETTISVLDHDASAFDHLATLYVPPLALIDDTRTFEGLRRVVAQLRNPDGGCPWDLEQTHETLKRYLLEEAYEALDALDGLHEEGPHKLAEELGDLMMQVLLHAQVAEDGDEFAIEDVVHEISTKLIRRHPHVFGSTQVGDADEVLRNWETLKKAERAGQEQSLLDHVPKAMPALAQAQSLQSRASKANLVPTPLAADALTRALADLTSTTDAPTAEALGALLFGIVALARGHSLDAEEALRMTIRRFREEVGSAEQNS